MVLDFLFGGLRDVFGVIDLGYLAKKGQEILERLGINVLCIGVGTVLYCIVVVVAPINHHN